MPVSIHLAANALDVSFGMASAALAAKALDSTLGVPGAVIFKGVGRFSQLLLQSFGEKCLDSVNLPYRWDQTARAVAKVFAYFGALAITWKVLAVAGFAFSLKHLFVLNIATDFIQQYVVAAVVIGKALIELAS